MRGVLEGKNQKRCARGVTLGTHLSEEFCFSAYLALISSLHLSCFLLSHVRLSSTLWTVAHRGIFWPRGWTGVSCTGRWILWPPSRRGGPGSTLPLLTKPGGRSAVEVAVCCVQLRGHVQLFETPWTAARQASLAITVCWSLPVFVMSVASVRPSSHLILWALIFCPRSFPASGADPVSQLLASEDQNTRVSASASVLPTSIQCWFSLRLTGLISLLSKQLPVPTC